MKRAALAAMLVACGGGKHEPVSSPTTAKKVHHTPDDDRPPGEIVTDQVVAMNKGARPAKEFRKGSVDPITAPKPTKTAAGFQVVFGHATVTTPTVYQHEVIVSGGFSSKELYQYEVKTGKPPWGID